MNRLSSAILMCTVWLLGACATAADSDSPPTEKQSILAQGEEIFTVKCDYCHGDGMQKGGTFRLGLRYKGEVPALLQERTDLTPAYIKQIVRNWSMGMAAMRPSEISDSELDALIVYLTRNNN